MSSQTRSKNSSVSATAIILRAVHQGHLPSSPSGHEDLINTGQRPKIEACDKQLPLIISQLAVITAIVIPLTFIVGMCGMNFDRAAGPWNTSELGWSYGYLLIWLLMIAIAAVMGVYFKRKG